MARTASTARTQVLGYLYAAALEAAGVTTKIRPNLGTREILIPALKGGDIDLLPECQGALLHYLDAKATATEEGTMQNALAIALPRGFQILPHGEAENADAFAVTKETAEKCGLKSLADLAKHNASSSSARPPRSRSARWTRWASRTCMGWSSRSSGSSTSPVRWAYRESRTCRQAMRGR